MVYPLLKIEPHRIGPGDGRHERAFQAKVDGAGAVDGRSKSAAAAAAIAIAEQQVEIGTELPLQDRIEQYFERAHAGIAEPVDAAIAQLTVQTQPRSEA